MPLSNSAEHVTREAKDTHLIRNSTHIKNKLLCTPTSTIKGQLRAQQFNCYGHKIASKRLLMFPFPSLSLCLSIVLLIIPLHRFSFFSSSLRHHKPHLYPQTTYRLTLNPFILFLCLQIRHNSCSGRVLSLSYRHI